MIGYAQGHVKAPEQISMVQRGRTCAPLICLEQHYYEKSKTAKVLSARLADKN
jgi:hypothetical protein